VCPKIVDREAKKLEILQAALQVFSQKGISNTKMIDIARAASIGKGTIYEYFSSKEDIFITGFHQFFAGYDEMISNAIKKQDHPSEQLKVLIHVSLEAIFEEQKDFIGILMDFWAEGIRSKDNSMEDAIHLKEMYQNYRMMIRQIIDRGIAQGVFRPIDSMAFASFLLAAIDGLMLQWVMEPELFDMKQIAESLCDGMLNGIRN